MLRPRRIAQVALFTLFVAAVAWPALGTVAQVFFRTDALAAAATAVAARAWIVALFFGLGLVVLTVLWGRVFCGWACPLGTMVDLVDYLSGRRVRAARWRSLKYHALVVVACFAAVGLSVSWLLDPLNWAARIAAVVHPRAVQHELLASLGGTLLLLAFLLGRRAFCRLLCPLGALLGLLARVSLFRRVRAEQCTSCGQCMNDCRMAAIGPTPVTFDRFECIHCHECDAKCAASALSFSYLRSQPPARPQLARRSYLYSLGGGLALALGLAHVARRSLPRGRPLRPPRHRQRGEVGRAVHAVRLVRARLSDPDACSSSRRGRSAPA